MSLEHVHAQNSDDPIKNEEAARSWINDVLLALKGVDTIYIDIDEEQAEAQSITQIMEELSAMSESSNIDMEKFNGLRMNLQDIFNSKSIHDLCNLALISKKDNSALNKSIFPVKELKSLRLKKQEVHSPCTKNVFLKFYSHSANQPYYWSIEDQANYFNELERVIKQFLA